MSVRDNYGIKHGYLAREKACYFEDSLADKNGIVHQPDIYALASFLAEKFGCTHILDIGCGRGGKLVELYPKFGLIGVDFGPNIAYCQKHYSFGDWLECDLEKTHAELVPADILKTTLIVCSDVIEHLESPDGLLNTLSNCLIHAPVAILSTPERDLVRGVQDQGPPANPAHVREWNCKEFEQYLQAHDFNIAFCGLTNNNDRDLEKKTILSILHGRSLPPPDLVPDEAFRVVAFMTAYNESDIIFHSIRRLIDSGIEVYLLDNWSSDQTRAVVEPLLGKGLIAIEQFPPEGETDSYDWQRLLRRVETLAATMTANWYIHHDVDEIRESAWPELGLRDAIRHVDKLGFNAIDHTVINFQPTDNSFVPGTDFGAHFTHWDFGRRPGHFQQIKAWKNLGQPLTLAATGGHDVDFPGRKVFPYKFLLRHYPVRSQSHGEKKVLAERKPRFTRFEKDQLGWHTQYDAIAAGHSFLAAEAALFRFAPENFYAQYLVERISGIGIVRKTATEPVRPRLPQFFRKILTRLRSW